jgi:hypothetical protein
MAKLQSQARSAWTGVGHFGVQRFGLQRVRRDALLTARVGKPSRLGFAASLGDPLLRIVLVLVVVLVIELWPLRVKSVLWWQPDVTKGYHGKLLL